MPETDDSKDINDYVFVSIAMHDAHTTIKRLHLLDIYTCIVVLPCSGYLRQWIILT